MADKLGYKTIFWSLFYFDYNDKKPPAKEEAFSKLIQRIYPGAVLLLHNTAKINADVLDELIKKYKEMGYEFKNPDCLKGVKLDADILVIPTDPYSNRT